MDIKVYNDRRVRPAFITVANQHENMTRTIDFDFIDCMQGHRYLILTIDGKSTPFLILGDKLNITSVISQNNVKYIANIVISDKEITDRIDPDNILFISDTFYIKIQGNDINVKEISEFPIPPELQLPYDELLDLIEEIDHKLSDGEFNGKSAYEIAVENGFEGTEEEWLQSLDYEHSDEFTQLATQVRTDAEQSAQNAKKVEQSASEASTSAKQALQSEANAQAHANSASQSAIQTSQSAESAGQSATAAKQSEDNALQSKEEALNSANKAKEEADKAQSIADTLDPIKFAVKENAEGNPVIISDSADWENQGLNLYGQSEQDITTGTNFLSDHDKRKVVDNAYYYENVGFNLKSGTKYILNTSETVSGIYFMDHVSKEILAVAYQKTKVEYTPEEDKTVYFQIYKSGSLSDDVLIWLNVGEYSEYEPYTGGKPSPSSDYPQDIISKEVSQIKVTGTNLFDAEWIKGFDEYRSQSKNIGSFSKGKYCLSVQGISKNDIKKDAYFAIRIKVGETYTNTYWIIHPSSPNPKALTGINFDIVSDFQINLYIYNDTEEQLQSVYETLSGHIQLNNNFNAKPYEPYKEQIINLTSPITLRGIPVDNGGNVTIDGQQYVSDVICEKDGVIGVERNCVVLDVDSSQTAIYHNNNNNYKGFYKNNILPEIMNRRKGFGNYIPVSTSFSFEDTSERVILGANVNTIYFIFSSFYDESLEDKGLSNFQSFLDEHDVKIVTYITEPTFEPLPEADQEAIRKLKTFYPNTVIDANCFTKIKYVADTKLYIDKKVLDAIQEVI